MHIRCDARQDAVQSLKQFASDARAKVMKTRKAYEADRKQALKPLWQGVKDTALLELEKIETLAEEARRKIEEVDK